MAKLAIVTILFFTKIAGAQTFYSSCTPLSASATAAEINTYNACVANNRASAQSSGTAAAQAFTISGSTVVAPPAATSEQTDILNKNANINSSTTTIPLTAEQVSAVTIIDGGAAAALAQSMRANTEGETTYLITTESTLAEGLGKLSMAGECASVSSSGCYNQRSELFATGAGYLLAQRQAQDQVAQHQEARNIACIAKNQITSTQESCGSALDGALSSFVGAVTTSVSGISVMVTPGVTSSPFGVIFFDPITGACSPPSAPGCKNISQNATPPSQQLQNSVREILKQKYAGKKPVTLTGQSLYSTNADGSLAIKGGGVYSKKDFSDVNSLKAKGLSDSIAQNIMKGLSSVFSGTSNSSPGPVTDIPTQSPAENSSTVTTSNNLSASKANAPQALPDNEDKDIDREPASLKKKIGSEFIGVAKDDIFKIINRRYRNEEKDDYFY